MTKRNKIIYWVSTLRLSLGVVSTTEIVTDITMKDESEFIIQMLLTLTLDS